MWGGWLAGLPAVVDNVVVVVVVVVVLVVVLVVVVVCCCGWSGLWPLLQRLASPWLGWPGRPLIIIILN